VQCSQADFQHLGRAFSIALYVIEGEFDVRVLEFHQRLARLKQIYIWSKVDLSEAIIMIEKDQNTPLDSGLREN